VPNKRLRYWHFSKIAFKHLSKAPVYSISWVEQPYLRALALVVMALPVHCVAALQVKLQPK
jgi:hypothetical protein